MRRERCPDLSSIACTFRPHNWQCCLVGKSRTDPSSTCQLDLIYASRLLTTPLLVSSAATAYCLFCCRGGADRWLDLEKEEADRRLLEARLALWDWQMPLERDNPDLRSMVEEAQR